MMMQGKVALITGGAQGLGKAIGETLLKRGARVCLVDVQGEKGAETTKSFQNTYGKDSATFIKCDVVFPNELSDAFSKAKETFGGLDIVCNNAGIVHETNWERMLAINLSAVIRGTYLAIAHMAQNNGGRGGMIINMASAAGLYSVPACPAYAASKAGVVGFSRSIGENSMFTKQGIRVNCLCPFFTDTDILNWTEEQVVGKEMADNYMSRGVVKVPAVVDACMHFLDNPSQSGGVLRITVKGEQMVHQGISISDDSKL